MLKLIATRLRSFRPTPVAAVLFVIATVRMAMAGSSAALVGVCAGIVPYMCVYGRWPQRPNIPEEGALPANMLVDWLSGLALSALYLVWMLAVTLIASAVNPFYEAFDLFAPTLALAATSDVVFVSTIYPIGSMLPKGARLLPAIVIVNAQLAFMGLDAACGIAAQPWALDACAGFSALVAFVTVSITIASRRLGFRGA